MNEKSSISQRVTLPRGALIWGGMLIVFGLITRDSAKYNARHPLQPADKVSERQGAADYHQQIGRDDSIKGGGNGLKLNFLGQYIGVGSPAIIIFLT